MKTDLEAKQKLFEELKPEVEKGLFLKRRRQKKRQRAVKYWQKR